MIPRDAMPMLDHYLALLAKWNPAINLVAPGTIKDAWNRHFLDSAQLHHLAPASGGNWVDLGSGAGFPGLVLAILRKVDGIDSQMTLIEADQRKSAFLMTVIRDLSLKARVIVDRIETAEGQNSDRISARALANLPLLLGFMQRHAEPSAIGLFPKGRSHQSEVDDARQAWDFTLTVHASVTDPDGVVLEVGNLRRK